MNPDTCGRADSIRIRIRVDAETFQSGKKSLRIQKYPDTCGCGNFSIRKEKFADSKVSGYEWTGPKNKFQF